MAVRKVKERYIGREKRIEDSHSIDFRAKGSDQFGPFRLLRKDHGSSIRPADCSCKSRREPVSPLCERKGRKIQIDLRRAPEAWIQPFDFLGHRVVVGRTQARFTTKLQPQPCLFLCQLYHLPVPPTIYHQHQYHQRQRWPLTRPD